jgi:hypothetical protein
MLGGGPVIGYAEAQGSYLAAGWNAPLPLQRGTKWPPPSGFTGKNGAYPNEIDLAVWRQQFSDGNIAIRMPDDVVVEGTDFWVIGLDVDCYGEKTGAATLAEAKKRWGPLPPTCRITSRDDGVSGIRLYRIPAGVELRGVIKFTELNIGDVEVIQRHHRYAVTSPSIHPEGRLYRCEDEVTNAVLVTPRRPEKLPVLAEAWIEGLRVDSPRNKNSAAGHDKKTTKTKRKEIYNVAAAMTAGRPSQRVFARLGEALCDLAEGLSRHDTTLGHVMALLRYGRNGEPGVEIALEMLYRRFADTVGPDRQGGEPEAKAEFERMVTNAEHLLAKSLRASPKRVQWGAGRRL